MIALIAFALISIVFSFLCSIWEAVILSVTPTYIRGQLESGNELGKTLQAYKKDIDRPLSAILSLNTIAHTVGAILVGSQAGSMYGTKSIDLGAFSITYEAIVAVLMTLLILILSEIIPKTIGANFWRTLTPFTVKSLKVLLFLLAPLVWVSQLITKSLKNDKGKSVLSRADIFALANEGEKQGTLLQSESAIIRNLIQLERLNVRDIMTPRTVIMAAQQQSTLKEFFDQNKPIRFSRIPIYAAQKDEITGVVLKDDILTNLAENNYDIKLLDIKREITIVQDDLPLPELFDVLVQRRIHMAVAVDNYGSLVGIVTMEDLLETILGIEITDELDKVEDLQRLAREKWNARAIKLGLVTENESES